jgi:F0F1-type ATP synthase membrane subunit b/b'
MTAILLVIVLLLSGALVVTYFLKRRVEGTVAAARQQTASAEQQRDAAIANIQAAYEQKVAELDAEAERIRAQYEAEARKIEDEANSRVAELEPLRGYAALKDAETEVQKILADAVAEATALRQEAKRLVDQTHEAAAEERMRAQQRVKEIGEQADALLTQATRDAGRIVADAEKRAEQIGGDAYTALRDKQLLEQAAAAMRNIIEGYGDRYIIPTHSVLDDLAIEFGYDAAGMALKSAREQSRRMVEKGEAAACDYVEAHRREIAIRFVIDAFNGRVDAILSRAKHDNYGTLEQEIRDAFSLVNLNGQAFRNARILPAYLDARLAELKWAAVVQELARKQREEQRYLKERLRDEEKARKEYEEKMRQAAKEEELKRRAVEETEQKVATATMEQKAYYEQELQRLRQELADATQRALTIAQQTKKGHVYIISNVGSFGEGVYKIGLTRRPEPQDRVDELGGASVPFEFDVHALIESKNAPALEHKLHKQLLPLQLNKINSRKEFFRVGLADIHREVEKLNQGEDFTVKVWTEKAIATEYRDSLDIENDPQKKENWVKRQQAWSARQLQLDMLKFPVLSTLDTDDDNQET